MFTHIETSWFKSWNTPGCTLFSWLLHKYLRNNNGIKDFKNNRFVLHLLERIHGRECSRVYMFDTILLKVPEDTTIISDVAQTPTFSLKLVTTQELTVHILHHAGKCQAWMKSLIYQGHARSLVWCTRVAIMATHSYESGVCIKYCGGTCVVFMQTSGGECVDCEFLCGGVHGSERFSWNLKWGLQHLYSPFRLCLILDTDEWNLS